MGVIIVGEQRKIQNITTLISLELEVWLAVPML